jgi:hypothetical protein
MMHGMKLTLIVSLTAALIAGASGWVANGWRLNAQIDKMVAEHEAASAAANKAALERYAALEQQKQEALNEANRIAQRNAAAAASARADADRLRNQIASADRVSTATVASLRNYTITLQTVFGECVAEVERLAATADGHALDSRTLNGAWPR